VELLGQLFSECGTDVAFWADVDGDRWGCVVG
jgi:hypothetical protein